MKRFLALMVAVSPACDGGGGAKSASTDAAADVLGDVQAVADSAADAAAGTDTAADVAALQDASGETGAVPDAPADIATTVVIPPITEDLPLRAAADERLLPVPLGIGTSGFAPAPGSTSPFTGGYAATEKIHTHPRIKTLFIEGGKGRIILIRLDTIGVSKEARRAVLDELKERTGADLSQNLFISATHTHSGPGRLSYLLAWQVVQDTFFPEFFERFVHSIADSVVEAYSKLEPARVGHTLLESHDLHGDRRCGNGDIEDPRMPVVRIDRADGTPMALAFFYAIHGTVLGSEEHALSMDASGGLEMKIAERFDHDVTVVFFNSWAGDMSPGDPGAPPGTEISGQYTRTEALGNLAADIVHGAFANIATSDKADVKTLVRRVPLNRDAIGYQDDEFPYEWGAVYCGIGTEESCWPGPPVEGLEEACVAFTEEFPGPDMTLVSVATVGDLLLVTLPGEPLTPLAQGLLDDVSAATGKTKEQMAMIGYAQDYTGYLSNEWDWWQGGYEASGATWGPKQGDYLAARSLEAVKNFLDPATGYAFAEPPETVVPEFEFEPYVTMVSEGFGNVTVQPAAAVSAADVIEAVVTGGDPWLGAPLATLERKNGEAFVPVLRPDGVPVDSRGYEFELSMEPVPSYKDDPSPEARLFNWNVRIPASRRVGSATSDLGGVYRLRFTGEARDGGAGLVPFDVSTAPFEVK